jgi:hypothetical protein
MLRQVVSLTHLDFVQRREQPSVWRVLLATVAWPITIRITSQLQSLFVRMAILASGGTAGGLPAAATP